MTKNIEKIASYLSLTAIKGISSRKIKKFVEKYKTIESVFSTEKSQLKVLGFNDNDINKINNINKCEAYKEIEKIANMGGSIITLEDNIYPQLLKEIYDPPSLLYVLGNVENFKKHSIAIVGSRKASKSGREFAYNLASKLAENDFIITSGLAYGIDISAHLGAISKGSTIAVLGSGLNNIYPTQHKKYINKLIEKGLIITEFPLATSPKPFNFPKRNRIISGLSIGICVVEASPKSGSLITANLGINQNREIFAVPNTPYSYNNGTNKLIKEGAKLTENYLDIIEEFPYLTNISKVVDKKGKDNIIHFNSKKSERIYRLIEMEPRSIDEIIELLDSEPSEIISEIVSMELDNLIYEGSNNKYCIKENI
ncbi:MAG: DNA-processing protein DprA [Deferribacterota bacterium]|nr:DNA-processing protein DprA [Deferribacterota bacterium]